MESGVQLSTTNYTPEAGLRGHYKLIAPFTEMTEGFLMTCKSVTKISAYISEGMNVLEKIYTDNGLTEDDYNKDVANDINIITLWSDGGTIVMFPSRYLLEYPNTNGVAYMVRHLHVVLPAFPYGQDYNQVVLDIRDIVQRRLGVPTVKVSTVQASEIQMVDREAHEVTVARRNTAMTAPTPTTEIIRLQALVNELRTERDQLLDYVAANMPPP